MRNEIVTCEPDVVVCSRVDMLMYEGNSLLKDKACPAPPQALIKHGGLTVSYNSYVVMCRFGNICSLAKVNQIKP